MRARRIRTDYTETGIRSRVELESEAGEDPRGETMNDVRRLSRPEQLSLRDALARRCSEFARLHDLDFNTALTRLRLEDRAFNVQLDRAYELPER